MPTDDQSVNERLNDQAPPQPPPASGGGGLGLAKADPKPSPAESRQKSDSFNKALVGGPPAWDDPNILGDSIAIEDDGKRKLVNYLLNVWENAKSDKDSNGVNSDMLKCLNMFQGQYEHDELMNLKIKNAPLVYLPLSEHKVHTLESWVSEFFTNADNLISLKPTPVPEMENDIVQMTVEETMSDIVDAAMSAGVLPPPDMVQEYAKLKRPQIERRIMDEAQDRAMRMEKVLKDDLVAGDWTNQVLQLISYCCIYGTAGMRCPVIKRDKVHTWKGGKVSVMDRLRRSFEVISPLDLYPAAGMVDENGGDLCVRVRYFPQDLAKMRGTANWHDEAINRILEFGNVGVELEASIDDIAKTILKQDGTLQPNRKILEGFEFWGQVSGDMLVGFGITRDANNKKIKDSNNDWYDIQAIVIQSEVLYCRILRDGESRPISICRCYNNPGSFWGRSPLQILEPIQRMCNACARNICTNMGFASGPQVVVDLATLSPKDDLRMRPLKVWVGRSSIATNNTSKPIDTFNVPSLASELTNVLNFFMRMGDELTGIPAYANGTDAATGASRTATGLSMLLGAANRGVKHIVYNFNHTTEECVRRLYWWHMEYNPDESVKGDVDINILGMNQFVSKTSEATERLNLLARISQDPRMAQLQSPEELCRMLREIAPGFNLEPDALAPDLNTLRQRLHEQQEQQQMQAAMQQEMMAQAAAQERPVQRGGGGPQDALSADRHLEAGAETTPTGQPSRPKIGGEV